MLELRLFAPYHMCVTHYAVVKSRNIRCLPADEILRQD